MKTLPDLDEWIEDMEKQHTDTGCQGSLVPQVRSRGDHAELSLKCDRCGELLNAPGTEAYFYD